MLRVAEIEISDTWGNIRNELDRMYLVTMATSHSTVSQRSELTVGERHILSSLKLAEPPRFFDVTPALDPEPTPASWPRHSRPGRNAPVLAVALEVPAQRETSGSAPPSCR